MMPGALAADSSAKPVNRAWITGYLQKWSQAKMLVGCTKYIDVLKAPAILSLFLEKDGVNIIYCIKQILSLQMCLTPLLIKQLKPEAVAQCEVGSSQNLRRG